MSTLHLNLHKKFFDMILSGEKPEEYREFKDCWIRRLKKAKLAGAKTITFSNGYRKDRRQFVIEWPEYRIGFGQTRWGADSQRELRFVLTLGKILSTKSCEATK